jgi:CRISPR-associated protein Csd1
MSWIQELYETSLAVEKLNLKDSETPCPICHMHKIAHIEVVLNSKGEFLDVRRLESTEAVTIIPATENSANRSGSKIAPHPLCEELSYCAKDLPGGNTERYKRMRDIIASWLEFDKQPSVEAVFTYLEKGTLYDDLIKRGVSPSNAKT